MSFVLQYILTRTVRQNLRDLVRVVSLARLPVLLQGETSVGKTSLITYLAQASGNRCLRINNHEHTDLQEYIGGYAADEQGNLVFKEGMNIWLFCGAFPLPKPAKFDTLECYLIMLIHRCISRSYEMWTLGHS